MKPLRSSLLAGAAAMVAGTAQAQSPNTHVLTDRHPGGGIASQIGIAVLTPAKSAFSVLGAPVPLAWVHESHHFRGFGIARIRLIESQSGGTCDKNIFLRQFGGLAPKLPLSG